MAKNKKVLGVLFVLMLSAPVAVYGQEDVQYIVGSKITTYENHQEINHPESCYSWDGNVLTLTTFHDYSDFYDDSNTVNESTLMSFNDSEQLVEKKCINDKEVLEHLYRYEYDQNGKLVKETSHNANNDIIKSTVYEYNSSDDLIKMKGFDGFDNEQYVRVIEYNTDGRKYSTDNSVSIFNKGYNVYEYDEKDRIKKVTTHELNVYSSKGWEEDITNECIFEYLDEENAMVEEYDYGIIFYSYDEKGEVIYKDDWRHEMFTEDYEYDETGSLRTMRGWSDLDYYDGYPYDEFEYDSYGNITHELHDVTEDGVGEEIWRKWEYNSNNQPIKCFLGGNWEEWEYDSFGNEIKYTYFYKDGTIRDQVITEWIAVPQYVADIANALA